MAESLGTARTRGRGLLAGRWWPVGQKLILDQRAPPVPEIMGEINKQINEYMYTPVGITEEVQ
jgi:hypothetical protein